MKTVCAVLFSCIAMPAMADCVTQSDLDAGIRATLDDGSYEDYRRFDDNLVEMTGYYDDYVVRILLAKGAYVIELVDLEDGQAVPDTRLTYSFPVRLAEFQVPKPDLRWTVEVGGLGSDGFFSETQSYVWGPQTTVTYDGCSYAMIAGQIDYASDGDLYSQGLHYLPDLGISFLVSYTAGDETDVYTYVALEALGE